MIQIMFIFLLFPIKIFTQTNADNTIATNNSKQTQLNQWKETLNFGISSQRLNTVKQIRSSKATNSIEILQEQFLKDNNRTVKEEIIYTFIDLTNDNSEFWKKVFSEEKDLIVLQRAAFAVEKLKIESSGPEIFSNLSSQISNAEAMRFNASAVRALGEIKFQDALPVIIEIATNKDLHQDLRGSAVVAVGMYQDAAQIPLLESILTNSFESQFIRRYAALGIGRTESTNAIAILSPIAVNEKEDQSVRLNAVSGLGYIANDETITIMEQLTKSDDTSLRTEAIKSLGKMKATNTQEILKYKAINDPEAIVRREAKKALQEMGIN